MIDIDQHLFAVCAERHQAPGRSSSGVRRASPRRKEDQHGAIAIMFVVMLFVLFGFMGLAFDLSMTYNRKVEMQTLADAAAIAAASQLVGTNTGVQNALTAAAAEAANFRYKYHKLPVTWSNDAIQFSREAGGPWVDATSALASPDGLLFANVDTGALDPAYGTVTTTFMGVVSAAHATASTRGLATAGRSSINVTPLAVCALSLTPASARNNLAPAPANVELVEYGFRRGVSYNLMNLNFNNTTAPESFVINPIDPLGAGGSPMNIDPATVGPFVCTGTLPMPRVTGGAGTPIAVGRPFPIASLFNQLNSRFDQYVGGLCKPESAPPDANVRAYFFDTSIPWMTSTPPTLQAAQPSTIGGNLWTIASPLSGAVAAGSASGLWGPLWTFAKAVPYTAATEPAGGYPTFTGNNATWATLYSPATPKAVSYPAATPYAANAGANFLAPPTIANRPGVRLRRVLNVPLLSCPVAAGANTTATVVAIGRFFMTVPATSTTVHAEFAGLAREQSLGGPVELIR